MAGKLKLRKWDSAAHLETEADIARYWEACLEEGRDDPAFITSALGNIARARGMSQLARKTGLTREGMTFITVPNSGFPFGESAVDQGMRVSAQVGSVPGRASPRGGQPSRTRPL